MGTKEKLIDRFCKMPKDFTYEETLKNMDDESHLSTLEK